MLRSTSAVIFVVDTSQLEKHIHLVWQTILNNDNVSLYIISYTYKELRKDDMAIRRFYYYFHRR